MMHHADLLACHPALPHQPHPFVDNVHIAISFADESGGYPFKLIDDICGMQVTRMQNTIDPIKHLMHMGPKLSYCTRHVRISDEPDAHSVLLGKLIVDDRSRLFGFLHPLGIMSWIKPLPMRGKL